MTDRQKAILEALVSEFMKTAEAVGSSSIVSNYRLGVSPATVRNELVALSDQGYLDKSHFSAGRVPTDLGIRYFVNEIMDEQDLANTEDVRVKILVFKDRFDVNKLLEQVLKFLNAETGYAAIGMFGDTIRFTGLSGLTGFQELRDVEILDSVLYLLENQRALGKIFARASSDDVCMLIGRECDMENLRNCAFVFVPVDYVGDSRGYVGVLGPRRMNYPRVIPLVRAVKQQVENSVKGW